jgi:outer membrane receptor protein involved in Fe transport
LERSANNPNSDPETGLIQVRAGNRIPGLPRDSLKFGVDYQVTRSLALGADLLRNSGQYFRGDEANSSGQIAGYCIVNAHATLHLGPHFKLFTRLDNAFDKRFYTFGILGDPTEIFPTFTDARFLGPGAPRAVWLGVSFVL